MSGAKRPKAVESSATEKKVKKVVDWDAIEPHYRANIRSLKDIGKEFGVSDAGIIKHARDFGWTRDLKAKIVAKAEAKVSAAAVSEEVSVANRANEQQVIEANAELQYQIRMEHRRDIKRTRGLFLGLLGQLETVSSAEGKTLVGQLFTILHDPEDGDDQGGSQRAKKMAEMLDKVLSLPSNIDSAKKLTEMLEKLVRMEREAFGIGDDDKGGSEVDRVLQRIANGG